MTSERMHWFIAQPAGLLPETLYLHVFDDGEAEAEMDWLADRAGALRFGCRDTAARFAAAHRIRLADISGHPADERVGPAHHVPDRLAAVS